MAQKRKKTRRKNNGIVLSEHVIGAIYILFAVLGFLGMGYLGVLLSNVLRLFVGDTYKVAFILMIIFGCCLLLTGKTPKLNKKRICGLFICWSGILVMFSALMFARLDLHARFVSITWQYLSADLMSSTLGTTVGGGLVGSFLYTLTYFLTAQLGSYLAADVLCFFGLCMMLNLSAQDLIDAFGQMCYVVICWLKNAAAWLFRKIKEILSQIFAEKGRLHKKSSDVLKKYVQTEESRSEEIFDQDKSDDVTEIIEKEKDESLSDSQNEEDLEFSEETFDDSDYKFPSLDLLTDGKDTDQSSEQCIIRKNKDVLIQTLESFGVKAELKNVMLGPAVTRYELHPAIGVKVSKIVNLADDLALALAAKDIRIEAPIPGKPLIGIEVPNQNVATVAYKTIITEFKRRKGKRKPLEVPLGHNVSGNLETADLAKRSSLEWRNDMNDLRKRTFETFQDTIK